MLSLSKGRQGGPDSWGCVALTLIVTALILLPADRLLAQTGKEDYRHYCASCHGLDGTGRQASIGAELPDLTQLRRRNRGKFPFEEVYEVVDGHSQSLWHRRRADMPYWGEVFREEEKNTASKAKVEARIAAIVEYIRSLQQK
jgi:mono/diheme cytochrome c family protein